MNPQTLVYIVLLYDGGETSQVICEKQISINFLNYYIRIGSLINPFEPKTLQGKFT